MIEIYLLVAVFAFMTRGLDLLIRQSSVTPMSDLLHFRIIRSLIWPLHIIELLFSYTLGKRKIEKPSNKCVLNSIKGIKEQLKEQEYSYIDKWMFGYICTYTINKCSKLPLKERQFALAAVFHAIDSEDRIYLMSKQYDSKIYNSEKYKNGLDAAKKDLNEGANKPLKLREYLESKAVGADKPSSIKDKQIKEKDYDLENDEELKEKEHHLIKIREWQEHIFSLSFDSPYPDGFLRNNTEKIRYIYFMYGVIDALSKTVKCEEKGKTWYYLQSLAITAIVYPNEPQRSKEIFFNFGADSEHYSFGELGWNAAFTYMNAKDVSESEFTDKSLSLMDLIIEAKK